MVCFYFFYQFFAWKLLFRKKLIHSLCDQCSNLVLVALPAISQDSPAAAAVGDAPGWCPLNWMGVLI